MAWKEHSAARFAPLYATREMLKKPARNWLRRFPTQSTKRSINPCRLGAADTSKRTWERCPNAAPDRCP
jgi:hypothetical protein